MIALLIFIVIVRSPNSSMRISCLAIFPFSTFFLTLSFFPTFFFSTEEVSLAIFIKVFKQPARNNLTQTGKAVIFFLIHPLDMKWL